jgi:two-component sensor histidine kinase
VWLSTKTPLRDGDGRVVGLVGVSVEITERKQAETRQRLMVHELNHRVKNTLAMVHAMASQTLRTVDPVLRLAFQGRLEAMAAAHDILTEDLWSGADLASVIARALAPFGGSTSSRFRVSGPPLRLLPRAAIALVMGLHELATNATKYGALSNDCGVVELRWQQMNGTFLLVWTEVGGPLVSPPSQRGFGTRLIERSLARDLGGTARLTFAQGGVVCAFEVPLGEVVAKVEELLSVDEFGPNQS